MGAMTSPTNGQCANMPCARCGYDSAAIVTGRWEFAIARAVHSLNFHMGNYGGTRWAYRRDRDDWQWEFKVARINARIPIAIGKRRVTLTRLYSGRERAFDVDNLAGGMKLVVDAMVREGLMLGDDPARAELHHNQNRAATSGLSVVIEELGA
jgi:Holliday junction resolvase RusA-like endonuclease